MEASPGAGSRSLAYPDISMFTFSPPPQLQSSRIQVCESIDNNITCPHGQNCYFAHPGKLK